MQQWTPLFGGCAVGLIALAACSPPASDPPTISPPLASSSPSVSNDTPQASHAEPSVSELPPPSALATDALSDVVCAPDSGGSWSFSGTLTNPGSAAVKYTVAIAVGTTSSPAGHAMIEETVAPGAKVTVRAEKFASGAPNGSTCEAVVSK
jgi:hypothetical protein